MADQEGLRNGENDPLDTILDRYIKAIATSHDDVKDLWPAIFYDKDEMLDDEFRDRYWKATGAPPFNGRIDVAFNRYQKMKEPPLRIQEDKYGLPEVLRINRKFYDSDSFYQTAGYNRVFDFLLKRLG